MLALGLEALAALAIGLTLLPFVRHTAWWVRVWDFPRMQVAVLLAAALGGRLLVGPPEGAASSLLVAVGLIALGLQLWQILPFTPLWRRRVLGPAERRGTAEAGPGLSMVVVNVLMENRNAKDLLAILDAVDPDLVLVLEPDDWWAEALAGLGATRPHIVARPQPNTYGMILYSRLPLVGPVLRYLLDPEIPSIRTGIRLPSGHLAELWAVHPHPPVPEWAPSSLGRDAELILVARELVARPPAHAYPAIVAGDLNDVAWSHSTRRFLRLSGLLDPRVGRGFYNSFDARRWPIRWPLDHVFQSPEWALWRLERLPAFGSDHFPILVELRLAPGIAALQEPDEAEAEDHSEAAQTLIEAHREKAEAEAGERALPSRALRPGT